MDDRHSHPLLLFHPSALPSFPFLFSFLSRVFSLDLARAVCLCLCACALLLLSVLSLRCVSSSFFSFPLSGAAVYRWKGVWAFVCVCECVCVSE